MRQPLHAICPYFAMFPETFVETHITAFTKRNDLVYEPFSGRGTTILQSLLMGRQSIASDINPVAYCISAAKAKAPSLGRLLLEINALDLAYQRLPRTVLESDHKELPPFFKRAFHPSTMYQLLFLRKNLNWQSNTVQRFITALVLGSLHGEMDKSSSYFSNQMPRTISPKPGYAVRYWRARNLWPPRRDVFGIIRQRAKLRLASGRPEMSGRVALTDVRHAAARLSAARGKVKAVITSPPYFNTTRAEEDQWLRLWFLGQKPKPTYGVLTKDDRHTSKLLYWKFLAEAWKGISPLLSPEATLVCRLGAKAMEQDEMRNGLVGSVRHTYPDARLVQMTQSPMVKRQTDRFRPGSVGCRYEVDFVLVLGNPKATSLPDQAPAVSSELAMRPLRPFM